MSHRHPPHAAPQHARPPRRSTGGVATVATIGRRSMALAARLCRREAATRRDVTGRAAAVVADHARHGSHTMRTAGPRRRDARHRRLPGRRRRRGRRLRAPRSTRSAASRARHAAAWASTTSTRDLLDATVDITKPEALVYELDASGQVTGLVAHEYIVPVDAWTSQQAADAVRHGLPPPPHPAAVGAAHLAVEGQPGRRVRGLEPGRPAVPGRRARSSAPTCRRRRPLTTRSPRPAGASRSAPGRAPIGTIPPVRLLGAGRRSRRSSTARLRAGPRRARRHGHRERRVRRGQEHARCRRSPTTASTTAPVLWGACDPLSTPRPLGPLHDVADQLGDDVAARAARARRSRTRSSRPCSSTSGSTRRVLVVDDLHWADQGTIDLLRFLLRRIRITGSLVVGAMRDDEVGATHPLRSLLGDVARSPDAAIDRRCGR